MIQKKKILLYGNSLKIIGITGISMTVAGALYVKHDVVELTVSMLLTTLGHCIVIGDRPKIELYFPESPKAINKLGDSSFSPRKNVATF